MSPATRKTLFVVMILGAVFAALYFFGAFDPSKRSDIPQAQTKSSPNTVEGLVLRSGKIDSKILSTGTVVANEEIEIRSEIAGFGDRPETGSRLGGVHPRMYGLIRTHGNTRWICCQCRYIDRNRRVPIWSAHIKCFRTYGVKRPRQIAYDTAVGTASGSVPGI